MSQREDGAWEREREVILARTGLDGREPETLRSIAKRLRLTEARVKLIEKRGLRKVGLTRALAAKEIR